CTLALSPIRDTLIEGFSHFVTSMTAPIASGWSDCRVGLAPTGKRRLCTAHTQTGPQRKAALRFIFTKSLFARLQTQPFFPRLKSCGSAAGPIQAAPISSGKPNRWRIAMTPKQVALVQDSLNLIQKSRE